MLERIERKSVSERGDIEIEIESKRRGEGVSNREIE